MGRYIEEPEEIQKLLQSATTIAVVGLSDKPDRDSNRVSSYMQKAGYRIIPVNPGREEILGEKSYKTLASIPHAVDIVNVFRRSDKLGPVIDDAISAKAKVIWLQLGIHDQSSETRALEAGIDVIFDRCIMVEHRRAPRRM